MKNNKKKKSQIGFASFSMHDFATDLFLGQNLSPSTEEIKKDLEERERTTLS